VQKASVRINQNEERHIGQGLMVLLGAHPQDDEKDIDWLINKIIQMRIFSDEQGKMNLSLEDIRGDLMIVSQFTLFASTKKGNRPSFNPAAPPDIAIPLYEQFLEKASLRLQRPVVSGEFGAHMEISLINDGPITIQMDSKKRE